MIATDVVVSYIQQGCASAPDGIFHYPISGEESIAVAAACIERHPYCMEYRRLVQSLRRIGMYHHTPSVGKTWIFFDGLLADTPDRRYAIAITNVNEYTVHVYKKSTGEHMFFTSAATHASAL